MSRGVVTRSGGGLSPVHDSRWVSQAAFDQQDLVVPADGDGCVGGAAGCKGVGGSEMKRSSLARAGMSIYP